MKILITGGTGLIGRFLCKKLLQQGHAPVVLSRDAAAARDRLPAGVRLIQWQPRVERVPTEAVEGAAAVINLAGENIGAGRWTTSRKRLIMQSRVEVTRALVEAFRGLKSPPRVFISGSAIGYYGPCGDEELTETSPPGHGFLTEVCRVWEQEAHRAGDLGVRVVTLRTGIVLAREGGTLPRMVTPFRLFLGGPLGSGRQWVSWIHIGDAVWIILLALKHPTMSGPINLTAPEPARMDEFASVLGRILKRPSGMRVPAWVLKMVLGEMAGLLLTGQRVLPARALEEGYEFRHPGLARALEDLLVSSRPKKVRG
ncbi:MAG: TIGR01777 family protein [Moorella humiferrea]|nr:TIGR01777 family protein [Moorella humiferrea]